jgi:hypothetical protein
MSRRNRVRVRRRRRRRRRMRKRSRRRRRIRRRRRSNKQWKCSISTVTKYRRGPLPSANRPCAALYLAVP